MFPTYYPQYTPQVAQPQKNTAPNWVQGDAGAKAFIVAPGSSVILMDSESDHFYLKAVDGSGMPSLRKFKYEEIGNTPQPTGDFVARSEFEDFKRQISELIKGGTNEQPL